MGSRLVIKSIKTLGNNPKNNIKMQISSTVYFMIDSSLRVFFVNLTISDSSLKTKY